VARGAQFLSPFNFNCELQLAPVIQIIINDKDTIKQLGQIAHQLENPDALLKVLGRRGANELKDHFRRRNLTPNKLGGRRTNFWRQVADSVNSPVPEGRSRIRISITHPAFAQKVFGGTITPKRANALTIPVAPEAHGRTVAVFQQETGIQLFLLRKKGGGLSNLLAGLIAAKQVKVFYVLVKSVDQAPDPDALPDRQKFNLAILETADEMLQRQIKNPSTTTSSP
jgi:hypothetical protein